MPKDLKQLAASDVREAIEEKKVFEFTVSDAVTHFSTVTSLNWSQEQEMPPSFVVYDEGFYAMFACHQPPGLDGLFTALVITVYRKGGRIFYRRVLDGEYIARVDWTRPSAFPEDM